MSLIDKYFRNVPEYYDTMYADGFTPEQILYAKRRQMDRAFHDNDNDDDDEITITTELRKQ